MNEILPWAFLFSKERRPPIAQLGGRVIGGPATGTERDLPEPIREKSSNSRRICQSGDDFSGRKEGTIIIVNH
ncbi:MAG: hypothetical protein LLH30_19105 [Candidatus Manganitrophus sp. SA1]|nr:hypothetical protein [Candidatus Manganitrophus morganii]